ncbi:MAG TPA: N-acetyltransferase [Xanthomarina gelatinilytica]|uniref:N-acetyltransferase n=1 Tax=Xanthomarina gelatinilytica TaxID=1137281 RepID=A0A3D6BWW2_9FLAO|nr:N-acetyltransferase [Xanthomarina gelatinilytica]
MLTKNQIIVRQGRENDSALIYRLILELAKDHNQTEYVKTNESEIKKAISGQQDKIGVLVAELNSQIVGYLSFTWNYSIWNAKEFMALDDLFVNNKFRGMEIGKKLMEKAKELCINRNVSVIKWEVEMNNEKAIRFYRRLGATINIKGIFKWYLTP